MVNEPSNSKTMYRNLILLVLLWEVVGRLDLVAGGAW